MAIADKSAPDRPARAEVLPETHSARTELATLQPRSFMDAWKAKLDQDRASSADTLRQFPAASGDGRSGFNFSPAVAKADEKKTTGDTAILQNPNASMADKAAAAGRLFESLPKDSNGRAHIKLNDGGKEREFEIDQRVSGKDVKISALFTKDEKGKEHPVIRWIDRKGEISPQCDKSGACVDYQSNWAKANMQESTVARSSLQPPRRGDDAPQKTDPPAVVKRDERVIPPVVKKDQERFDPAKRNDIPFNPWWDPKSKPSEAVNAPNVVSRVSGFTTLYTPRAAEGGVYGNQPPRGEGPPVYLPDHTLQKFLQNPVAAGYAAAAGDPSHGNGRWGTMFRIPEMNNDQFFRQMTGMSKDQWVNKWGDAYRQKYGFDLTGVHWRVVDTGSAIKGSGRVDLAVDRGTASNPLLEQFNSPHVKRRFGVEVIDKRIKNQRYI